MFFLGILVNDQLDKTYLYYQYSKAETFFFTIWPRYLVEIVYNITYQHKLPGEIDPS